MASVDTKCRVCRRASIGINRDTRVAHSAGTSRKRNLVTVTLALSVRRAYIVGENDDEITIIAIRTLLSKRAIDSAELPKPTRFRAVDQAKITSIITRFRIKSGATAATTTVRSSSVLLARVSLALFPVIAKGIFTTKACSGGASFPRSIIVTDFAQRAVTIIMAAHDTLVSRAYGAKRAVTDQTAS